MTHSLFLLLSLALVVACKPATKDSDKKTDSAAATGAVTLDFHIMSKCPFGVKVLQAITPVIEKMGDAVKLNVHYIGKEKDGEMTSMHGEQEVKGDIIQLCARETGDQASWLEFLKCQNEDWRKIPEGWENCAKTAKLDAGKMKSCIDGDQGKNLLKESFKASEAKQATGSPTIFLNGEPYKGGRSETSFGRAICAKINDPKVAYCKDIPAPVKVPVTIVGDKRCNGRGCDPQRFMSFISHTFEGAEIKELDYADAEGKALFEKSKQQFLPIAVFGPEVEKEEAGYNRLKRRLTKIEGTDQQVYPLGRDWDPKAEICDDKADNTGDGKVDCDDPTCEGKKVCRAEIKNKLDLFIMSQCPYGVRTGDAMGEVIDNFNKDAKLMDFEINFIGQDRDGTLSSMHGQGEVDEDIRQICAQKIYKKGYKFMEYVLCRNKDYRATDWEACAKNGIQAAAIKKCAEGEEGKALLAASFKKAADLGISGSPGWLLNNKYDMNARNPEAIKKEFCDKNPGVKGCEKTLSAESNAPPAGSCGGGPTPPAGGPGAMPPGMMKGPGGPGMPPGMMKPMGANAPKPGAPAPKPAAPKPE
jgi:hypothetical protein